MAKINIGDIGKILDLGSVVLTTLSAQADKKTTDISKSDVPKMAPAVTKAVEAEAQKQVDVVVKEAQSRIDHALNQEGPLKSYATQGSIIAVVGALFSIWTLYSNGVPDGWEQYSGPIGVLFGTATVLYGRWVANKPIGE